MTFCATLCRRRWNLRAAAADRAGAENLLDRNGCGLKLRDMRDDDRPGVAPNYTNAFLVSAFVLVWMALCVIWAIWGFLAAGGISWVADRVMLLRRKA